MRKPKLVALCAYLFASVLCGAFAFFSDRHEEPARLLCVVFLALFVLELWDRR